MVTAKVSPQTKLNLICVAATATNFFLLFFIAIHVITVKMVDFDYNTLPNYLKNLNSVLEDSNEETKWVTGSKPDYSVVNDLYTRGN